MHNNNCCNSGSNITNSVVIDLIKNHGLKGEPGRDGSYTQKAYKTYTAMVIDKVNIPANTSVAVNNDPDKSKNGYYTYDGTVFTKSDFDPQGILTKVDSKLDQAVNAAAEYFEEEVTEAISESMVALESATIEANASGLLANNAAIAANNAANSANTSSNAATEAATKANLAGDRVTSAIDRVNEAIKSHGYVVLDSFQLGATINTRNEVLMDSDTASIYRWSGALPKVVPEGSTPESTGGIGEGGWLLVNDIALRQEITRSGGASAIGNAAVEYDTLIELVEEINLPLGTRVSTLGYHSLGDGGANSYIIVPANTGIVDGGEYIDMLGVPYQLKATFKDGAVRLHQFGAVEGQDASDALDAFFRVMYSRKFTAGHAEGSYTISRKLHINAVYPANNAVSTKLLNNALQLTTTYSSNTEEVVLIDGIRSHVWNGYFYINCGGTAYNKRRNYKGFIFNTNCSYAVIDTLRVYGSLHDAVTIRNSTQITINKVVASYSGTAKLGDQGIGSAINSFVNTGSPNTVTQRCRVSVEDLPETIALQDFAYIRFGNNVEDGNFTSQITGIDRETNTLTVYPWLPDYVFASGTGASGIINKPSTSEVYVDVVSGGTDFLENAAVLITSSTGKTSYARINVDDTGAITRVILASTTSANTFTDQEPVTITPIKAQISYMAGAALKTIGNDSNLHQINYIDALVCGVGHAAGALYGASIGVLCTQFCGIGLITGRATSDIHYSTSITSAYFEANGVDILRPNTAISAVTINNTLLGFHFKKCEAIGYKGGTATKPSEQSGFRKLTGLNIFVDGVQYNSLNGHKGYLGTENPQTGGMLGFSSYYQGLSPVTVTLAAPNHDVNRLFGMNSSMFSVSGRKTNGGTGHVINIKPPKGYSINGLAEDELYKYSAAQETTLFLVTYIIPSNRHSKITQDNHKIFVTPINSPHTPEYVPVTTTVTETVIDPDI